MSNAPDDRNPHAKALRHFGRFQLLRPIGRSTLTMLWLAADPRNGQEVMVAMPRRAASDGHELALRMQNARRAVRLDHPGIAPVLELDSHDGRPYAVYERGRGVTLAERLGPRGMPAGELVPAAVCLLQALAFAHEAGVAHHDIELFNLLHVDPGRASLLGLGLLDLPDGRSGPGALRDATERDLVAVGLMLHQGLTGLAPLDDADFSVVTGRMAPFGHEFVRLVRREGQPLPEALRAIVNRATDRQERQRYRNARTFERALAGWLRSAEDGNAGPLAVLIDRIRAGGVLPALPGAAARAGQLVAMDGKRMDQLAEVLLQDVGLSFELLRQVNSAGVRGAMGPGNGPILTVRRAIALIGLDGVRRAARAMKAWPGVMPEARAFELEQQMALARHAGRVAQALRPAGYDGELVYLLALLQRLGRLVVQYHCPDEATQIRRLMSPAPGTGPSGEDDPGMSEQAASFAVLGVDLDAVGSALAQSWGFDAEALALVRRVAPDSPVHPSDRDVDVLRCTASCANEVIDALQLPPRDGEHALHRIAGRYGRLLHLGADELRLAARGEATDAATRATEGAPS